MEISGPRDVRRTHSRGRWWSDDIESIELGRERRVNARRGRRAAVKHSRASRKKPNASLTSSETALRSGFSRAWRRAATGGSLERQ